MGLVLFEVGVRLEFVLGNNMPSVVKICLFLQDTDFKEKLKEWLQKALTAIRGDAQKVCDRKKAVEAKANTADENAAEREKAWNGVIKAWEDKIKLKEAELKEKAEQSAQSYERCKAICNNEENKICIPFFVWEGECWKVWGHWIGCPKWSNCATKIANPFCLLECEIEHLKNSFLEFIQGAINKLEKAISVVADGLKKLVDAFQEAIKLLKAAMEALAKFVTELVLTILEHALEAFLSMIDLKIKKLELKATFGLGFRKCFSYEYDIEAFGEKLDSPPHSETEICLDEILITVAKWIFGISPGLKKHDEYYDKKDKAEGFVESVEEAETEVKKTDETTTEEVDIETSKEVIEGMEKRNELPTHHNFFKHVDTIKNKYYHQYSDDDLQVLNTPHHMKPYEKPAHVVKFMDEKAPWKMAQQTIDNPPSHQPQLASNVTVVKRSLILGDPKLSPCDRVKRSLQDYASLTNGLMQSIMHMENGKVSMNVQRRNDVNKLSEFYAKTHKLGSEYTNYTPRQKRDIYYWYEQLKDGYQEHFRLTKRSFVEHQRDTLPKVKESLDDILGKHVGSSFESYTDELHRHAIDGFKRSNIPNPNDGETLLHGIKRNLTLIVTNEEFPLTHMKRHLNNVNQAIRAVNKQVMQC